MTKLLSVLLASLSFAAIATGEDLPGSLSFSYRFANSPTVTPVAPLGTIAFPDTAAGKTSTVTLLIQTAQNSPNVYAIQNAAVSGSGFSLFQQSGTVPAMANGFGSVLVNFTPSSGEFANGLLQFTLSTPTGVSFDYTFSLFGRITAPRVITSYTLSSTNNQTSIQSGSTIPFPSTAVNATSQATFIVSNTGTAPATIDSVSLAGEGYTLGNLSLVPAALSSGSEFRFTILFSPLAARRYRGTLTVSIAGAVGSYSLDGQGTTASFTYRSLNGSAATALLPGATLTLPDTPADGVSKTSLTIQVTNSGNADGALSTIALSGTDFQLANLPALPRTLPAGASVLFDVVYQPSKPGGATGRLQVGEDLFPLAANGLGAVLSLSADVGTGPIPLATSNILAVPNTAVGARRTFTVIVANTGNRPATVSSFSVAGSVFTTPTLPALPVSLAPGASQRFEIRFAPVTTGSVTGSLTVNDQAFTLAGSGDPPAALPAVTISGVGPQTDPLQQPSATVQLASAYPADLRGVLTLAFLADTFSDDPAIQFANGSRTVNFTIPANTTQAIFEQLGRTAPFQTGTVSGTVLLSARFTVGNVEITPNTAPSLSTSIPQGPPQLSSVRLGNAGANTIQLLLSGYSTARSVTQLTLQFAGATGANLQTKQQTVDVASAFANWYANPSSRSFGSQFTLILTLTVTGDGNALQSISVTASNALGTSAPRSVALR